MIFFAQMSEVFIVFLKQVLVSDVALQKRNFGR